MRIDVQLNFVNFENSKYQIFIFPPIRFVSLLNILLYCTKFLSFITNTMLKVFSELEYLLQKLLNKLFFFEKLVFDEFTICSVSIYVYGISLQHLLSHYSQGYKVSYRCS